jgi:hypothetical protein
MLFLHDYISQFENADLQPRRELGALLRQTKTAYDLFVEGDPVHAFEIFVERYNWLGLNKATYGVKDNESRNLVGALMQDYLLHLVIKLCKPYPSLDVFTEVPVSFGRYPLWQAGEVRFSSPSERSDLAVGYILDLNGEPSPGLTPWPRQPYYRLPPGQSLFPLVTINSKIRVSQSEFFDWLGREQLMTKGNPHCLSVQIALRKEMDMSIVQAAQAGDKFFLLGEGGERNVVPNRSELLRFSHTVSEHLNERMNGWSLPSTPP